MIDLSTFLIVFLVVGLGGGMAFSMYLAFFYEPKPKKSKAEKVEAVSE